MAKVRITYTILAEHDLPNDIDPKDWATVQDYVVGHCADEDGINIAATADIEFDVVED